MNGTLNSPRIPPEYPVPSPEEVPGNIPELPDLPTERPSTPSPDSPEIIPPENPIIEPDE